VVGALALVEHGLGFVGDELEAAGHVNISSLHHSIEAICPAWRCQYQDRWNL
jgi:hypothetical protein